MSDAARTAESLDLAYQHLATAHSAAVQHRSRGDVHDWRKHVQGLHNLVTGMASASYILRELAGVAKACADDARAHYSQGTDPDGREWPNLVIEAGREVDRALTRLKGDLEKARVGDAHAALALLHAAVQNTRNNTKLNPR